MSNLVTKTSYDKLVDQLVAERDSCWDESVKVSEVTFPDFERISIPIQRGPLVQDLDGYLETSVYNRLGIPVQYAEHLANVAKTAKDQDKRDLARELLYESLKSLKDMLPKNGSWLARMKDDGSNIRCRVLLSEGYTVFSNLDALYAFAESAGLLGGFDADTMDYVLKENYFWARILLPQVRVEIRPGEEIMGGAVIGNSEIGQGSAKCWIRPVRLVNGVPQGGFGFEILSEIKVVHYNTTRDAIYKKVTDSASATLSKMENYVHKLRDFVDVQIKNPEEFLQVILKDSDIRSKQTVDAVLEAWRAHYKAVGQQTGYDICVALITAPMVTKVNLPWEEELRLEKLAATLSLRQY